MEYVTSTLELVHVTQDFKVNLVSLMKVLQTYQLQDHQEMQLMKKI